MAAAVPEIRVADCAFNVQQMISLAIDADKENVAVVVFPELSVTAYTCADLFYQHQLLSEAETGLQLMVEATNRLNTVVIFGLPLRVANELYNVAVVAQKGRILGIVPKTHLPNNGEFYEKRWFASGGKVKRKTIVIAGQETTFGTDILFENGDFTFAIELCEDLWLPIPPSCQHGQQYENNQRISKCKDKRSDIIAEQIRAFRLVGLGLGVGVGSENVIPEQNNQYASCQLYGKAVRFDNVGYVAQRIKGYYRIYQIGSGGSKSGENPMQR